MNAIETAGLVKKYRGRTVIDHVSMNVPEGSIFGFVGENGAGKTTIMRLVTGLAEPNEGSYSIFGVSNKDKAIYKLRERTSAIVEATSLVPNMNAKQNIVFAAMYLGLDKKDIDCDGLLAKVGLADVGKKLVKNFSLGMKQRLGIALALLNNPKLMLLDEPMNGLDPEGIAELRDLLLDLNKNQGITILISSHILSELEKIATHYGIISHGKLLKSITESELHDGCRKAIDIKVDDVDKALKTLEEIGLKDYKAISNGVIKIFDEVKIAKIVTFLDSKGIDILSIESKDESIEEYYLSLLKEGK